MRLIARLSPDPFKHCFLKPESPNFWPLAPTSMCPFATYPRVKGSLDRFQQFLDVAGGCVVWGEHAWCGNRGVWCGVARWCHSQRRWPGYSNCKEGHIRCRPHCRPSSHGARLSCWDPSPWTGTSFHYPSQDIPKYRNHNKNELHLCFERVFRDMRQTGHICLKELIWRMATAPLVCSPELETVSSLPSSHSECAE